MLAEHSPVTCYICGTHLEAGHSNYIIATRAQVARYVGTEHPPAHILLSNNLASN